jgi:hypothetical protein
MDGTLEQKKLHQTKANLGIGGALLVGLGSTGLFVAFAGPHTSDSLLAMFFIVTRLAALGLWFWGLSEYSLSKGHSGINALWGLLGLIGLLVLAAKKDQYLLAAPDTGSVYPRGGQNY